MNIAQWAMLAVLALPVVEIYLMIMVGAVLGFFPTLMLLLGAAFLGTYLLQTQGWSTWSRLQQSLARGEMPAVELANGAVIVIAAALLLLPGFLSDIVALFFLIPVTRTLLARWLINSRLGQQGNSGAKETGIIEGEFRRED